MHIMLLLFLRMCAIICIQRLSASTDKLSRMEAASPGGDWALEMGLVQLEM